VLKLSKLKQAVVEPVKNSLIGLVFKLNQPIKRHSSYLPFLPTFYVAKTNC
jgi:hypothetical protein